MKFNLFALSAIALCLLQQVQADATNAASGDLASDPQQKVSGETVHTVSTTPKLGETTATDKEKTGALGVLRVVGLSKRGDDGLGDLLKSLLGGVTELNGDGGDSILGNLDLGNLNELVGGLVKTVKGLLGDDGLLEAVGELLEQVIDLVEDLLKTILNLLGIDHDGLELDDLLDLVEGLLGDSDGLGLLDGKVLDLDILKKLLDTVNKLLGGGLGNDKESAIAGGLLKSVLDIVGGLLKGLGLDLGNVGGDGLVPVDGLDSVTKRSTLRRALVKRALARRTDV